MSEHHPAWMDRLAHDLRGPLSPVQTAVFLLRDKRVDDTERAELLDVIDRQSQRLGGMIDEISDWVRADKGRLIVRREPIELALLLDNVGPRLRGLVPEVNFAPGTEALLVDGDAIRLGQLLRTVLGFRLTRGDTSPIRIDIELATPQRVRLRRRIDCAGQAREHTEMLLSAPLPEPLDEGLGLGLLVSRAIAQAHDGELHVNPIDADTIELVVDLPLASAATE